MSATIEQLREMLIPKCEGCEEQLPLSKDGFCVECQKIIDEDSRHEDPAKTHGRPHGA